MEMMLVSDFPRQVVSLVKGGKKKGVIRPASWLISLVFVVSATVIGPGTARAGSLPGTGISGSSHDIGYLGAVFNNYAQDDFQRTCIFCHTPHNAQIGSLALPPLWNRAESTANLTPYTWAAPANLQVSFNADPLVGPSRLCMSCHDGVTAVDSHGPYSGSARGSYEGTALINSPGRYIDNLSVVHPIGFLYQDAMDARPDELIDPSNYYIDRVPSGAAAAGISTRNRLASNFTYRTKKIIDTLYGGYVTCATCHDAHNTDNAMNDPALSNPGYIPNYFVWAREQNSALCLSCHIK
jgi:Doubled CXXCH motif (Paired_CXXCH_1)